MKQQELVDQLSQLLKQQKDRLSEIVEETAMAKLKVKPFFFNDHKCEYVKVSEEGVIEYYSSIGTKQTLTKTWIHDCYAVNSRFRQYLAE